MWVQISELQFCSCSRIELSPFFRRVCKFHVVYGSRCLPFGREKYWVSKGITWWQCRNWAVLFKCNCWVGDAIHLFFVRNLFSLFVLFDIKVPLSRLMGAKWILVRLTVPIFVMISWNFFLTYENTLAC